MEDQLRFTAIRDGDRIAVQCIGYDRAGHPVDFELDADTFYANSVRQTDWSGDVEHVNRLMRRLVKGGVTPDAAWHLIEATLPTDLHLGTASSTWAVEERVTNRGDEIVERLNDLGRQIGDHEG